MRIVSRLTLVVLLSAAVLGADSKVPQDLESIKSEPRLEKRAGLALHFASYKVDVVLAAYEEGDADRGVAALAQIQEAVELAYDSLMATGKNPRKNPKHFKRAEIRTRELTRELEALRRELHYDERPAVDGVHSRITEINTQLLMAIMTKKKKKK